MNRPCNQPTDTNENAPKPEPMIDLELKKIIQAQARAIEQAINHMKQGESHMARQILEAAKL